MPPGEMPQVMSAAGLGLVHTDRLGGGFEGRAAWRLLRPPGGPEGRGKWGTCARQESGVALRGGWARPAEGVRALASGPWNPRPARPEVPDTPRLSERKPRGSHQGPFPAQAECGVLLFRVKGKTAFPCISRKLLPGRRPPVRVPRRTGTTAAAFRPVDSPPRVPWDDPEPGGEPRWGKTRGKTIDALIPRGGVSAGAECVPAFPRTPPGGTPEAPGESSGSAWFRRCRPRNGRNSAPGSHETSAHEATRRS